MAKLSPTEKLSVPQHRSIDCFIVPKFPGRSATIYALFTTKTSSEEIPCSVRVSMTAPLAWRLLNLRDVTLKPGKVAFHRPHLAQVDGPVPHSFTGGSFFKAKVTYRWQKINGSPGQEGVSDCGSVRLSPSHSDYTDTLSAIRRFGSTIFSPFSEYVGFVLKLSLILIKQGLSTQLISILSQCAPLS